MFAYTYNHLIDLKHAIIMDVEPTTAVRQAKMTVAKTMITRIADRLGVEPAQLAADTGYGSAEMSNWLVEERGMSRAFRWSTSRLEQMDRSNMLISAYDHAGDVHTCPAGKLLTTRGTLVNDDAIPLYRTSTFDCGACTLKPGCCPKSAARKVPRSIYEGARDPAREIAQTEAFGTPRREHERIETLLTYLRRILGLGRLRS